MQARIPLAVQIAEIEREIALRRRVYPRWIQIGRMKQDDADRHIATLEAARVTLQWLKENETFVRGAVEWARNETTGRRWLENYAADQQQRGATP
jgi:hypothetical protein